MVCGCLKSPSEPLQQPSRKGVTAIKIGITTKETLKWFPLSVSIDVVVLVTAPLRIGQYIGQYLASRLIKSGIEYVILAGSSVFSCCLQGLNTRYWAATPPPSSTNPPHSPSPCGCVCTHRQDLDALMRTSFVWCAAIGIPRLHSADPHSKCSIPHHVPRPCRSAAVCSASAFSSAALCSVRSHRSVVALYTHTMW